ncbi:AMP-binding protein, partial [Streptococcus anginosus]
FGEFKESNNLVTGDISKNTSSTDCAYLVFTSGTTGIPKGVIHTHESVLSHINRYSKYLNLDHDEPLNVLLIVNFIFSVSTTQIF